MAGWFRTLDLKSGGPWFKSFTLPLSGVVLSSPEFKLCEVTNWSAFHRLGFLTVYVLFEIFVIYFTVSPISTTVLIFDT